MYCIQTATQWLKYKSDQNLIFHAGANQRSGGVSIMEPDHPDAVLINDCQDVWLDNPLTKDPSLHTT